MKVNMMLCDAAQVADGKLYILGGGWSILVPKPIPTAIALRFEVDWMEADIDHHWKLCLIDADGEPMKIDSGEGPTPIELEGDFRVGRPNDLPPGASIDMVVAINLSPLPFLPSTRYSWVMNIDDQTHEDWAVTFTTRALD